MWIPMDPVETLLARKKLRKGGTMVWKIFMEGAQLQMEMEK